MKPFITIALLVLVAVAHYNGSFASASAGPKVIIIDTTLSGR
jgi:hypothetical protein